MDHRKRISTVGKRDAPLQSDMIYWRAQMRAKSTQEAKDHLRLLHIRDVDGGGRGPRTKPTLSRGNEGEGLESLAGPIDDPTQAGPEGPPSANLMTVIFVERIEFELF